MVRISPQPMPRVVRAGVPMRMPDGSIGFRWSNGIMFLLTVMPQRPRAFSAVPPVSPRGVTSARSRWLSVPPLTSRTPPAESTSASVLALATICPA